jgi:hypothetical protein
MWRWRISRIAAAIEPRLPPMRAFLIQITLQTRGADGPKLHGFDLGPKNNILNRVLLGPSEGLLDCFSVAIERYRGNVL